MGQKVARRQRKRLGAIFLTDFNGDWLLVGLVSLVTMSTKRKKSRSQRKRRELVVQTSSDLAITDGRPTEGGGGYKSTSIMNEDSNTNVRKEKGRKISTPGCTGVLD